MKDFIKNLLREALENDAQYKSWKRKNVTLRGVSNGTDEFNNAGASLGDGLYTASLSNKTMAKGYGTVYFVVNGRPKNPKVFNDLNRAEIWLQQHIYFKNHKNVRDFYKDTNVRDEVLKLGYDGIEIKGREIVNYTPENVKYFKNEIELRDYFNSIQLINPINEVLISKPLLNDNFSKWFNGSKVVDNTGNPLICYHGTGKKISKFNRKFSAQGVFWFTTDKNKILSGESGAAATSTIMEVFISAKNLAGWDEYEKLGLGQIRERGFDGVKLDDNLIIFEPTQIKSINNDGTWDINDKNIYS